MGGVYMNRDGVVARALACGFPQRPVLVAMLGLAIGGAACAQADEARARKIVSGVCFVCHGAEGESSSEMFPRLAGQQQGGYKMDGATGFQAICGGKA